MYRAHPSWFTEYRWPCEGRDHDNRGKRYIKVVGSYTERKELSGVELEDYHRPWVDDVTFTTDGVTYKRLEKVLDCWFESDNKWSNTAPMY